MNAGTEQRRVLGHTASGAASTAVSAGCTLALVAYLVRSLGTSEYGAWVLLTVVLVQGRGLASLLDLGLQQSIIQRIASEPSLARQREILGAALAALLAIGLIGGVLLWLGAPGLTMVMEIPESIRDDATVALRILAIQLAVEIPVTAFSSTLEGLRRYPLRRGLDALRAVLFSVTAVAAVRADLGLVGLALSSVLSTVLFGVSVVFACRSYHLVPRSGGSARHELCLAIPLLALRAAGVGNRQLDRIIIGAMLSAAVVSAFDVADRLNQLTFVALGVSTSALIPAAAEGLRGRVDVPRTLLLRSTAWSAAITLPMCAIVFALADPLTTQLAGTDLPGSAAAVRWLVCSTALATLYAAGFEMAIGAGAGSKLASLTAVTLGVNVVATLALTPTYGAAGSAAATSIATAVIVPGVCSRVGAPFKAFPRDLLRAVRPGAVAAGLAGASSLAVHLALGSSADLVPGLASASIGAIAAAVTIVIAAPRSEALGFAGGAA